jgi:hypothetical protein
MLLLSMLLVLLLHVLWDPAASAAFFCGPAFASA